MTSEQLLLQLRDIQPPPEPAWWLIAPAWLWLAAAVLALCAGVWLWLRRRQSEHLVRLAARELRLIHSEYHQNRDNRQLAIRLSRWLKQVALLAFPARQLQGTSGAAWLEFLDRGLRGQPFSRGCGRVFGGEVYRQQVELDADEVIALCERWLRLVKPRLQRGTPR